MDDISTVLNMSQNILRARLARLEEYRGCFVRFCDENECHDGWLEDVDIEALMIVLERPDGKLVFTLPGGFSVKVLRCRGSEA